MPMPARTVARADLYATLRDEAVRRGVADRVRQAARRRRGDAGRRAGAVRRRHAPPRATCSSARTACARVPGPSSTRRRPAPGTSACSTPAGTPAACACPASREWRTSCSGGAASSATSSTPTASLVVRQPAQPPRARPGGAARDHLRAVAGPAGRPVPRRHRTDARHHRGDRRDLPGLEHLRLPDRADLAQRPDGHHRRRRARHLAVVRPGRLDGDRGRDRARQVPARHPRHRRRVRRVSRGCARSGSSGSSSTASAAATARRRAGSAPVIRDLVLPMIVRRMVGRQQPRLDVRLPHRLARAGGRRRMTSHQR